MKFSNKMDALLALADPLLYKIVRITTNSELHADYYVVVPNRIISEILSNGQTKYCNMIVEDDLNYKLFYDIGCEMADDIEVYNQNKSYHLIESYIFEQTMKQKQLSKVN